MHPWQTWASRFVAAHHLDTVEAADCRVGPLGDLVPAPALRAFVDCAPDDAEALRALLQHPRDRVLVKLLTFATKRVPEVLFDDLVQAGVMTQNPTCNKHYIFPCAMVHGRRRVAARLVDALRRGSDRERHGAAGAMYWCAMPRPQMRWPHENGHGFERPTPDEPLDDLVRAFEDLSLEVFVGDPSLDVRRALVPWMVAAARRSPTLGAQALEIARAHPDPYLRARLRVDLGEGALLPCKPPFTGGGV